MLLKKKLLSTKFPSYRVATHQGRQDESFGIPRLQKIAETGNEMLSKGLKIPAPFEHNPNALPVNKDGKSDAFNNAGYWNRFWTDEDEEGYTALYAEIDIPGEEKDSGSPLFKALNTAKETSLSIRPEFEDGLGRKWKDCPVHVALVTKPVVPDQSDFEPASHVVNMSMGYDEPVPGNSSISLAPLIKKLRDVCKVYIPDNTTHATLAENLMIAVGQFELCPPSGLSDIEPVPVYMSTETNDMPLSKEQIEALISSGATNPATGEPFTQEDLAKAFEPPPKDEKTPALVRALATQLQKTMQDSISKRIDALVSSKRVAKELADSMLRPKVEFQMSTDADGQIKEHPLEGTVALMEATPAPKADGSSDRPFQMSGTLQQPPLPEDSTPADMPEELKEKTINDMLAFL